MSMRIVPELICSDLQNSLSFYCGLLGFQVRYARLEERFAFLDRAGAELMLEQPLSQDRLWPRAELCYPFGRGMNLEIGVTDAENLHGAVAAAGVTMFLPLETRWYRRDSDEIGVTQFAIQDPDGYLLRFSQALGTRSFAT